MDQQILSKYGIDYEKGLRNCVGNVAFYKKILAMFLKDQSFPQSKVAYMEKNRKELFARMHELKGVSGNAALLELYNATVPLVELLRAGADFDEEIDGMFALAENAYIRACEGIRLALNEA